MSNELLIMLLALLIIGGYVHAYHWGWQNGHDVHHDEPDNGPPNEPEPPRTLYT